MARRPDPVPDAGRRAQHAGRLLNTLVGLLFAGSGAVFAVLSLYLFALSVAATGWRPQKAGAAGGAAPNLVVVVPAHDEEMLIGRCVRSLLGQAYPADRFRIVVVADNCVDATAAVAREAGAEVMVRDDPTARGKGHALRWATDRLLTGDCPPDAVVVIDADSVADDHLLAALAESFVDGHPVVQADYALTSVLDSPRSRLVAAAFVLFHKVRFSGRARLGMAANLVGNGMLLAASTLRSHPWDAFIGAEDLEYSIRLRLAGIRPAYCPAAHVVGPGAASASGSDKQRMRWEGGRFHVVRKYLGALLAGALSGSDVSLFDAALDLATPPLAMLALAIVAGTALSIAATAAGVAPFWAPLPWLTAMAALPAFVVVGLRAAGAPAQTWRALLAAPGYVVWKALVYTRLLRGFDPGRWDRTDRGGPAARIPATRIDVAGVPVDAVDLDVAVSRLEGAFGGDRLVQVATVNLDFVVRASREASVRDILRRSDLNLVDGAPVMWLSRLLGAPLQRRVTGTDLIPTLLARGSERGLKVFLLGGEDGAASMAAAKIAETYTGVQVVGTFEPPRASVGEMDNAAIIELIAGASPDLLLVALGHPKQEQWIDAHRTQLNARVAIGVGCVFDIIAGRRRRAPRWMQQTGLEWAFRLLSEPRRLVRRYAIDALWLVPITAEVLRSRLRAQRRAVEAA